jgi:hypothetical protein
MMSQEEQENKDTKQSQTQDDPCDDVTTTEDWQVWITLKPTTES